MASLSRDPNGGYTIQVVCGDGKRRSIRLGKVNKKTATEVRIKVEHLNALSIARLPMDAETAAWVAGIGDGLAGKLAAVGLIPPRQSRRVGEFLAAYLDRRRAESKGSTLTNLNTVANDVRNFFGADARLGAVTEGRADEFRTHYLTRTPKLAPATVARRLKTVKMFFDHARKLKLLPANPFADVTATSVLPAERRHYVSPDETVRIIVECNPTWRLIVALARFGGLRCPSEVLSLKWEHVNFTTARMTVPSCKTEHHLGKDYRTVPIFAELRPYLDEAFELAVGGAEYVVPGNYRLTSLKPGGWVNTNLRTPFLKIVRRAGLQPWPRLFQNLRASRETDLMKVFPIHVVCAWLGNTPTVALRHYLQVLDSDYERAAAGGAQGGACPVQNAVQSGVALNRQAVSDAPQFPGNVGPGHLASPPVNYGQTARLGPQGFEP
jgi:integrase